MGLSWPQCPGPLISNVSCFGDPASGALASLTLLQPPRLGHQNSLHSRFSAKQQAVLSLENLVHLKTDLIYVSLNLSLVNDNIMAHHHSPCCVKLEKAPVISFLLEILTQTCQLPILSFYIFNSQR